MKRNKSLKWRRVAPSSVELAGIKVAIVGGTGGIGRALSRFMASVMACTAAGRPPHSCPADRTSSRSRLALFSTHATYSCSGGSGANGGICDRLATMRSAWLCVLSPSSQAL